MRVACRAVVAEVVRTVAVRGAFVTSESQRLIGRGLLAKRRNPHDSRSTLITITPAGRRAIERLVPEVRAVNDLFFGHLSRPAFLEARRFLDQLMDGSRQALAHIAAREEHGGFRAATRRARNGRAQAH